MRRFGLRVKLFLAFGIVLLPMLMLLIKNFRTNLAWWETLILEDQRLTGEAVAVQIDDAFDAAIGFAWAVANDPLIQTLDPSRLDAHLKQLMGRHPFYQEINVFDAQGVNRGYGHLTQSVEPRSNIADRRYFQSVMATNFPAISQVMELKRSAGTIGVIAAVPVRMGSTVTGVVTVVMTAEQLAKRYEETRLLPGQAIVLADRAAHLAFHSLRRKLSPSESTAFQNFEPLRAALAGAATTVDEFTDPVTNDHRLGVFVPTLRHHWAIGVTIPPSIALSPVYGLLRQQLITFVGMLLLSAVLAYLIARYLVRPFLRLEEAAFALGHGDLARRVDIHTGDEIEQLGVSFNEMAGQIQERDNMLREREARIRRLMESNIIGIFFWDIAGDVTEGNDAFLQIVGYTGEDLHSDMINWINLTPPEYRDADRRAMDELFRTGSCQQYDKEFIRKDGRRVPVLIGGAFLEKSWESGVGFVLDLTERHRAEVELKRHRDHLEERTSQLEIAKERAELANRAKSEFLAKMSHELRTPLNAVLGYAQILKRGKSLTADQKRGLNMIDENGWHLLTLINNLLDVSNIEACKLELQYKAVDLPSFMRSITDIIRVKAQEKGLAFMYTASADLPDAVHIDDQRLRQVILNLLRNALKFTDHGQVSLRARALHTDDRDIRLRIEVQDSGIGIAAEKQDAIFRPFEQVGDLRYQFGGSGLGLTISRQLVRLMGSDIHVESKLGEGSLFWFELDVRTATGQVAALPSEDTVISHEGSRKKVLVVDDVPANRSVMIDALGMHGFEMIEAESGHDALEKAQTLRPDLVLMDIIMPDMDGLEVTRRLRQLPTVKDVAIIAISADATRHNREQALAAGANVFLTKPVDFTILLKEIRKLLRLTPDPQLPEAEDTANNESKALLIPSPEEMQALYHIAMTGSMRDIRKWAAHLVARDERFRAFANQLDRLAERLDSGAILALVEAHMGGK